MVKWNFMWKPYSIVYGVFYEKELADFFFHGKGHMDVF